MHVSDGSLDSIPEAILHCMLLTRNKKTRQEGKEGRKKEVKKEGRKEVEKEERQTLVRKINKRTPKESCLGHTDKLYLELMSLRDKTTIDSLKILMLVNLHKKDK